MANVSLGNHYEEFAQNLLKSGRYNSLSEVLRDGLRLLEEAQELKQYRLELLKNEIQKGLDSGSAGALEMSDIKAKARLKLQEQKDKA